MRNENTQTTTMATPVRKSMRTRRSKRPLSPSEEEEKHKKKIAAAAAAAAAPRKLQPPPPDPLVDVVTVTTSITTRTSLVKPKASTPLTRQTSASGKEKVAIKQSPVSIQEKTSKAVPPVPVPAPQPSLPEPVQKVVVQKPSVKPVVPVQTAPLPVKPTVPAQTASTFLPTAIVGDQSAVGPAQPEHKSHCFKDPNFVHSSKGSSLSNRKSRQWKTLKQIASAERSLPWKPTDATYSSLEAPPSFKPAKKYSDISGFQAKYTDPVTKLRYTTTEEFSRLRMLPQDIVTGLLALRKATTEVP